MNWHLDFFFLLSFYRLRVLENRLGLEYLPRFALFFFLLYLSFCFFFEFCFVIFLWFAFYGVNLRFMTRIINFKSWHDWILLFLFFLKNNLFQFYPSFIGKCSLYFFFFLSFLLGCPNRGVIVVGLVS